MATHRASAHSENGFARRSREFHVDKLVALVQVVFSGLVDDADQTDISGNLFGPKYTVHFPYL